MTGVPGIELKIGEVLLVTWLDCGVPDVVTGLLVVEKILGIVAVLSAVEETDVVRMCVENTVIVVAEG